MMILSKESFEIKREQDFILFRNRAKEVAAKIGMSQVGQTKLITAATELMRNMLRYADGGTGIMEIIINNNVKGIRLTFADTGPGIANIAQAMQDGFSSGNSLGLGLPGAKRLSNEFNLQSEPGKGTTVTIIRWKNGS